MPHARSAVVVGASGFIGSAVANRLDAVGIPCARYTRSTPFAVKGKLTAEVAGAATIYWLASSIRPATSDAATKAGTDLHALDELLNLLAEQGSGETRLVAVSSGGTVYDTRTAPPYREDSPTRGANAYGEAMLAVEARISNGAPHHAIVRASNAYGPGQPTRRGQGVIAHWLDAIRREEPIRVLGDPETKRDYVYISDLVDALLLVADVPDSPDRPRIVNIGSGTGTSLAELIDLISKTVGFPIEVEYSSARGFDAPSTWVDVALARTALGFSPLVDLREGLSKTWRAASISPSY